MMPRTDNHITPPKWPAKFLRLFIKREYLEEIEGDMEERFHDNLEQFSARKARRLYAWDTLKLLRPALIKGLKRDYRLNQTDMFQSYFKIGWRNLHKHKGYSLINISGLAVGMSVAMLIGLWIQDEVTFNHYYKNYDRISRVMLNYTLNGEVRTGKYMSLPIGLELKESYPKDFEHIARSAFTKEHVLAVGDKIILQPGNFMDASAPQMLSLTMLHGTRDGLEQPHAIFLSASLANTLFGDDDPVNQIIRIDDKLDVTVTGVYEDIPQNTEFSDFTFLGSWQSYVDLNPWLKYWETNWDNSLIQVYAQIAPNTTFDQVSHKIKDIKFQHTAPEEAQARQPEIFLYPMRYWHLHNEFQNGKISGGLIEFVWLFGIIGGFVLFLACINFMNLSTARAQQRAKEVGIRKAVGSARNQLIIQFFSESWLVVTLAFILALLSVQLVLPYFNQVAQKDLVVPWSEPIFWLISLLFCLITCFLAGSYPAFYLSSFRPIRVLKAGVVRDTVRLGKWMAIPRQALVVLQFSVSLVLIIGTIIVFRQIRHTQDRPVGYEQDRLLYVTTRTDAIHEHFDAFRHDLLNTGAVVEVAESNGALTEIAENNRDFTWQGKDPDFRESFGLVRVSHTYGKTVDWELLDGRDFSRSNTRGDTMSLILNESAVALMGLEAPIGEIIKHRQQGYEVIGVVGDMVMRSPYEPARPTIFSILPWWGGAISFKLHPTIETSEALAEIEQVFKKYVPALPFAYQFVDQEYAQKFADEQRIGKLSSIFAGLAIFISCLGLSGLSSFIAEQRTKEIGIRKTLGASVVNLWLMLSKNFVSLVVISTFIAIPIAYHFLNHWLQDYEYRTEVAWWIFGVAGVGALLITLATISYQTVKAALANPVDSLRNE